MTKFWLLTRLFPMKQTYNNHTSSNKSNLSSARFLKNNNWFDIFLNKLLPNATLNIISEFK